MKNYLGGTYNNNPSTETLQKKNKTMELNNPQTSTLQVP